MVYIRWWVFTYVCTRHAYNIISNVRLVYEMVDCCIVNCGSFGPQWYQCYSLVFVCSAPCQRWGDAKIIRWWRRLCATVRGANKMMEKMHTNTRSFTNCFENIPLLVSRSQQPATMIFAILHMNTSNWYVQHTRINMYSEGVCVCLCVCVMCVFVFRSTGVVEQIINACTRIQHSRPYTNPICGNKISFGCQMRMLWRRFV